MSIVFVRQKFLKMLLTIVCAVSIPVTSAWAAGSVQVTVDKLNVRSGPSLQDTIITTLPNQTVLPVISQQNDWVQVKLPDGKNGWVANWLVSSTPSSQTQTPAAKAQVESTTDNLNVRSGPGTNHSVVQQIGLGTRYSVLQKNGDWIEIQLSGQSKGWVAAWLVKEVGASGGTTPVGSSNPPAATTPNESPVTLPTQVVTPKPGTVQGASLTLDSAPYIYATPDSQTPAIGQLHAGATVTVLAQQNGWVQFPYHGVNAWIKAEEQKNSQPEQESEHGTGPGQPDSQPVSPGSADKPAVQKATVNTDGRNLRSEANTSSTILTTLATGTSLTVLEKQGDWYRVTTPDGKTGWVAGWLVTVAQPVFPTPAGPHVTIFNPDTNIRSGPGTQHEIIKRVQTGEKYEIVKTEGDWFQVSFQDGTTGYIAGWLVSTVGVPAVLKSNELVNKVIVVDAGHGGNDNGATGSSFATLEKTVNLQVALILRKKLESAGAKVIMTRADDRKLTLQQRVDVAIHNQADIFVSIHHNTHPNTATNGTIVFYFNNGNSSKLASLVQNEIVKATSYKDMNARYGNYFVLRENPVPSILAEIGFLSNYNDEIRVRSEQQQELAADGLYKGIIQYFTTQSNQGG
ncbi:SH3 domain-containing protein [Brevibacillus sp. AY1]|uniref:SH3 domain-containing protein n=1 Tax=Brevibacillus sp. AY1 TaxID=2807621 RepID=UPI002454927B|nr:SH3 domain-containing protein [Brevibacillus sp. AY1]